MPLLRTIKDSLFRTYCKTRNVRGVWYHVLNREPKRVWQEHQPRLHDSSAVQLTDSLIDSLNKDGIAVTDVWSLFPDIPFEEVKEFAARVSDRPDVREEIAQHEKMIRERVATGSQRKGAKKYLKDFIVEPYGSTFNEVIPDIHNPYIRMNLDERVLKIAGSYMGVAPKLNGFSLRITLPVPAGATEYFSQRWHRDPEDRKMVKMFIYMTDVLNEASGPFIYIKGSQSGGPKEKVFPQTPPAAMYPDMGAVEKVVSSNLVKTCLGKAGTVIFADTSGLHKGGYTTTKPRLMYTGTFYSNASLTQHRLSTRDDLSHLSVLARYALGK